MKVQDIISLIVFWFSLKCYGVVFIAMKLVMCNEIGALHANFMIHNFSTSCEYLQQKTTTAAIATIVKDMHALTPTFELFSAENQITGYTCDTEYVPCDEVTVRVKGAFSIILGLIQVIAVDMLACLATIKV